MIVGYQRSDHSVFRLLPPDFQLFLFSWRVIDKCTDSTVVDDGCGLRRNTQFKSFVAKVCMKGLLDDEGSPCAEIRKIMHNSTQECSKRCNFR